MTGKGKRRVAVVKAPAKAKAPLSPAEERSAVDKAVTGRVSAATHLFLFLCLALTASFLAWAYFGKLDIVSETRGEVIPSTKVKRVQHLEGGIIDEILVHEGERVEAGQELLILEGTASEASVNEIMVRINSLNVDIARLQAELKGLDKPRFSAELAAEHPDLTARAMELFTVRTKGQANKLAGQREKIKEQRQEIKEIEARLRNARTRLELLREQIAISEDLLKDQLTSRYKHLAFLKEEAKLKSDIEEDTASLRGARSALSVEERKLDGITNAYQEDVREDMKKAERELLEFTERMKKFADSQKRTVIRSPVDGVVKGLYVVGEGEVVQPGETIMDIVPAEDRLIVEAYLPIRDIGHIQPGQRVVVKLPTADAVRYGNLEGKVTSISPDAYSTQDGRTFYKVLVATEQDHFQRGDNRYNLFPGMVVTAAIHTGKRTVLQYIVEPFLANLNSAMQER